MKMIFEDNKICTTFKDLQIGELFVFKSDMDTECPYVILKLTENSAFDLTKNEIGTVPLNLSLNSVVKRVRGHLVVEGVEE